MAPRISIHGKGLQGLCLLAVCLMAAAFGVQAQINAEQVMRIGQNSLYFEDYMLSIQYFNQAVRAKPYLAQPYFFRAIAKLNLDDYAGAEADASKALELNPFITDAYEVRGVARQYQGRNAESIDDYRHALALLPNNRQLMFNLAIAQQDAGMADSAAVAFDALLKAYPGFDNGYIGRARLRLQLADTAGASRDIDTAIAINPNVTHAYVMRADLAIAGHRDYAAALADMDRAIKLEPHTAPFYINRAFLRYNLDDYYGAMADYDQAIGLEPLNRVALFNRGILLAEVNANDRALADFSKILDLDPNDARARYNRSLIHAGRHDYRAAIADITAVIEAYPDFAGALMTRSDLYRRAGDTRRAMADYDKALAMNRKAQTAQQPTQGTQGGPGQQQQEADAQAQTQEIGRLFAQLLTVQNDPDLQQEFNNRDIRGKVQDRNYNIQLEGMMEVSCHASPTELRENTYYIREVDDLNSTRALRYMLVVTSQPPTLTDQDQISRHFSNIDYYNSYLATHTPRTVDYIGRAMDFISVHNYQEAIRDLDRAIDLTPDYPLAYMLRAQARHRDLQSQGASEKAATDHLSRRASYGPLIQDLETAVRLSPRTPLAYYNLANAYAEVQDYPQALKAYDQALALKPDLGEAYYNRGYVHLTTNARDAAIRDLSKAGELGVLPAYSLLKKISR